MELLVYFVGYTVAIFTVWVVATFGSGCGFSLGLYLMVVCVYVLGCVFRWVFVVCALTVRCFVSLVVVLLLVVDVVCCKCLHCFSGVTFGLVFSVMCLLL